MLQEEDTESKLMELHKQVLNLTFTVIQGLLSGGAVGSDAEKTETDRGPWS